MASKTQRDLSALLEMKGAELAELSERLVSVQADIDSLRRALELVEASETEEAESTLPAKELRNLMVEILRDEGHGLHYGDIHDQLVARGVAVPGKDPRRNVGAHLSNDDRFEKLGDGLWGLVSWGKSGHERNGWGKPVRIVGEIAG